MAPIRPACCCTRPAWPACVRVSMASRSACQPRSASPPRSCTAWRSSRRLFWQPSQVLACPPLSSWLVAHTVLASLLCLICAHAMQGRRTPSLTTRCPEPIRGFPLSGLHMLARILCAGERAVVAVRGFDVFQNPITSGGAALAAAVLTSAGAAAMSDTAAGAAVRDRGDGVYEVDCSFNAACDFEVPSYDCSCLRLLSSHSLNKAHALRCPAFIWAKVPG